MANHSSGSGATAGGSGSPAERLWFDCAAVHSNQSSVGEAIQFMRSLGRDPENLLISIRTIHCLTLADDIPTTCPTPTPVCILSFLRVESFFSASD